MEVHSVLALPLLLLARLPFCLVVFWRKMQRKMNDPDQKWISTGSRDPEDLKKQQVPATKIAGIAFFIGRYHTLTLNYSL